MAFLSLIDASAASRGRRKRRGDRREMQISDDDRCHAAKGSGSAVFVQRSCGPSGISSAVGMIFHDAYDPGEKHE